MPFAPPKKNSPAAPGRHRGFTHFLPAGGRSPGLLRLGWSRANGWVLAPAHVPPRRGAWGPATLSSRPSTPAPWPALIPAPQGTATDSHDAGRVRLGC